jgi:5-hydroxyisourate hydrolase-like protein (transthyretin family)
MAPALVNSAVGLANILPQLLYWLTQLLQLMGIKKKRKPWGSVFNSQTGQPIFLAMVRIYDKEYNRLLESAVTDKEGRFGFLARPGTFYIVVKKAGFVFPSQFKVSGFFRDIYTGGNITINSKDQSDITSNIPLDPQAKVSASFNLLVGLIKLNKFLQKIRVPLILVGTVFAVIMIILAYNIVYILSLALYALLVVLESYQRRKARPFGEVSDVFGHPLETAIVRIYNKKTGRLIATDVTDDQGRYKFLVNPGIYYMTAAKPGYLDFKSHIMYLERERTMVTSNIKLRKIEDNKQV